MGRSPTMPCKLVIRGGIAPGAVRRAPPPLSLRRCWRRSAPQPQTLDDGLIAACILALEIVELAATLADHHEEAAPRVKILGVGRQMVREIANALAQDRDLHLGRAGVFL